MTRQAKSVSNSSPKFGARDLGNFIRACFSGDIAFVKGMLGKGVAPNVLVESCGARPLTAAARGGHIAIVKLLLDAGADPNLQDTWVSMPPNGTALESAAERGHVEIAKLLVKDGADANKAGYWPPLKTAASHGQPGTVRFLLEVGARFEPSIIYLAARSGNVEVVRQLINAGADVNYRNSDGRSPLHLAALKESPEMAELLIAAGARLEEQTKITKETPLHSAASRGRVAVVRKLLDAGAKVSLKNFKGKTAEQWARLYQHKEVATLLREHSKGDRRPTARMKAKETKAKSRRKRLEREFEAK